jgi:hypothetical protein
MLDPAFVRVLLAAAALGHFVTIPALALAPRWGILRPEELRALSPINARIVLVVMLTIQAILLATGFTVLWAREDILAGGRLAQATAGGLAALWLARAVVQVRVYGPLFQAPRLRTLHRLLVGLFSFMACSYAVALVHAIR